MAAVKQVEVHTSKDSLATLLLRDLAIAQQHVGDLKEGGRGRGLVLLWHPARSASACCGR